VRYLIRHQTRFRFPAPVQEHQCEVRVAPRSLPEQRVLDVTVEAEPEAPIMRYVDYFDNVVHAFSVVEPHAELSIRVAAEVECTRANPFDFDTLPPDQEPAWLASALRRDPRMIDYVLSRSAATPALPPMVDDLIFPDHAAGSTALMTSLQSAMEWIREHFATDPAPTHAPAALADVLKTRAGGYRDLTHLLVAIARGWGVPARYVAGYVDADLDTRRTQAAHAWAEVLIPGAGWRGFDVTHDLLVNDRYVSIAAGRDASDTAAHRSSMRGSAGSAPAEIQLDLAAQQ
jgi:transglutaminase-like putative cysteine protease